MRPRLVITLLAVVLLSACGNTAPPPTGDPASDQSIDAEAQDGAPADGDDADDAQADAVVSVRMTQQGGLTGVVRTWRISERHPRHEHVFAAANRDVLEDPSSRSFAQTPCCEMLEYEVVIQYADGSTKQLRTWDAGDTDPALQNLVTAVIDSEPWHLDGDDGLPGGDIEGSRPST